MPIVEERRMQPCMGCRKERTGNAACEKDKRQGYANDE